MLVLNVLVATISKLLDADIVEKLLLNMYVTIVVFLVLINMAKVIITLRVMPDSPETDLIKLEYEVIKKIKNFAGETEIKREIEPVAFGLKALKIIFVSDEKNSNLDELENNISALNNVNSVEIIDIRRAIG